MLDNAPETTIDDDTAGAEADEIYCAGCGTLVTRSGWRISRNGDHEHTVFNPVGQLYRVVCFKQAPGVAAVGAPSGEFTWFKGYAWQIAYCRGCDTHLGWQYLGPDVFFGLIRDKLTTELK